MRMVKGKLLSLGRASNGYLTVNLNKEGKAKTVSVHRVTARVWIPNPNNLPMVLHVDDDRTNNKVGNLTWGTHRDNMDDMMRKGRSNKGSVNSAAKLTDKKVLRIRKLGRRGLTQRALADRFNISPSLVSQLINHKIWTHI